MSDKEGGIGKKLGRLLLGSKTGNVNTKPPLDIEVVDPLERFERAIRRASEAKDE